MEYFSENHFKPFKIDIKNCLNFVLFVILAGLFPPFFFEFKKNIKETQKSIRVQNFEIVLRTFW